MLPLAKLQKQSVPTANINPKETLVKARAKKQLIILPYYFRSGFRNAKATLYLRASVYKRLAKAASNLPEGLSLILLDGWRHLNLQHELLKSFATKASDGSDVTKFVFNPAQVGHQREYPTDDPPHCTGGSVDVTIGWSANQWWPMGTDFDEMSDRTQTNVFEKENFNLNAKEATRVRAGRRLLCGVMRDAGFTNYPGEWWHFDFGNAFWRFYGKTEAASVFKSIQRQRKDPGGNRIRIVKSKT